MAQDRSSCEHSSACSAVVIVVADCRTGNLKENTAHRLPEISRYRNVTLKRGLTQNLSLWNWINSAPIGTAARAAVAINLIDRSDNPVRIWKLRNGWPCRRSGSMLSANSGEGTIETLEIRHEGLESLPPDSRCTERQIGDPTRTCL